MSERIDKISLDAAKKISEYIDYHKNKKDVQFFSHVKSKRKLNSEKFLTRKSIYLDTNAWKCLADFKQGKSNLTEEMKEFCIEVDHCVKEEKFIFPIGISTFFELDSMTSKATRDSLISLVDNMSYGCCISPFHERIEVEIQRLSCGDFKNYNNPEEFICSPIELWGIPSISMGNNLHDVDEVTFQKSFFDVVSEMPFSFQLEISQESNAQKWSNGLTTSKLNEDKIKYQNQAENLNTAIFLELIGTIKSHFDSENKSIPDINIRLLALAALHHWHENNTSPAFPTLRVLSSLYGLMRFDIQRKYQDGDSIDFLTASSALPWADAFFTDRRLSNLINDTRLSLKKFSGCSVVVGFGDMAKYLKNNR